MTGKISYLNYIRPMLVGFLLLAGWLSLQIWKDGKQEEAFFRLSVSSPSGSFSEDVIDQMDDLPGLRRRWALYCTDVELHIENYQAAAKLYGVTLTDYPLTIVESAGEKRAGIRPLLIVGQDFFSGLSDERGNPISERQAKILKEQMASLAVSLTVQEAGGTEDTASGYGKKNIFQDAEFLGLAEEDGIYMDAAQMRLWLAQLGLPCEIRRVELEIQGAQNARRAQETLAKAGFLI